MILLASCADAEVVTAPPPIVAPLAADVAVSITPGPLPEGARIDDRAGLVLALIELGLGELPGVVPEVVGSPPSPGLVDAIRPRTALDLTVAVAFDSGGITVEAEACAAGACTLHAATAPSEDDPSPAVAEVLSGLAEQLGRAPADAAREAWGRRGTGDPYAARMAGRSAAAFYGLRAPAEREGDVRADPVARAFYLDPGMPVAAWIAGRTSVERHPLALQRASVARPSSDVLLADLAVTQHPARVAEPAMRALAARAPADARFTVLLAAHDLAMGRLEVASERLDALGPGSGRHAQVARLRVAIADAAGPPVAEELLARWASADPTDPEPVRRRLHRAVAEGDFERARGFLLELRHRGGPAVRDEADGLELALWFALGARDRAADVAERQGDAGLARRLRSPEPPPKVAPSALPRLRG